MNDTLLYFAMKYQGDFEKMLNALQIKEQPNLTKMIEYKNQIRHKYATIISSNYPEYFKTVNCPPIVLFYKGNINLVDELSPVKLSVLESGKRFGLTLDLITQNDHIAFDYVICAENQDELDKLIERVEKQNLPLKDYSKSKKRQMER